MAPFVEGESTPPEVARLGAVADDWWAARLPGVVRHGTLVVAPARDRAELDRFAARTIGHARIGPDQIAELEPALAGRFASALYYADEAHLDPRQALQALVDGLCHRGVSIRCAGADGAFGPDRAGAVAFGPDLHAGHGKLAFWRVWI
ncbi:FAD-dependent oxidoreductase [Pseudotabrizicola sp.]|uniref:FAD-dependent oxidoreductase n=1 Tax=Pseudotabrizicola sp. TaxID=2939647 RepID=UPI003521BBFA